MNTTTSSDGGGARVLIVDDDAAFAGVLARGLGRHGFETHHASDHDSALRLSRVLEPTHAVLDLKLNEQSGLDLIEPLLELRADMHLLVLTGFSSIATAVNAIKRGATHYLAKPVDLATIVQALTTTGCLPVEPEAQFNRPSPKRVEWEYIQRVLAQHDGNISATARALNMHRRTLQRKLAKRPVRD